MSITKLRRRMARLHRDEDGTALTEFTLFLPIWIVVLIGVLNLGRVGIFSTKVQLQAQKELWDKAVPLSDGQDAGSHMNPYSGYADTALEFYRVRDIDGNPRETLDSAEGVAWLTYEETGHYGESYDKSLLPTTQPFHQDDLDATLDPTEVLQMDETERYPHLLLNDTLTDVSTDSPISLAVQLSGFLHNRAAGIQYGSIFADKHESTTLFGQWGNVDAGAHYDTLVSPQPLKDTRATLEPASWAFALFKADEKYEKYLQWGEENWGGGSGSWDDFDGETDPDEILSNTEDEYGDEIEDTSDDCEDDYNDAQQEAEDNEEPFGGYDATNCY